MTFSKIGIQQGNVNTVCLRILRKCFSFRYNGGIVVVFRRNLYLSIYIEIFTEEMILCLRFVFIINLGRGGEMEEVGMNVDETRP